MKGLLIEDDPNKAKKVLNFLSENFKDIEMNHKISYQSGLQEIFENEFDFILLDMSLPTYDQNSSSSSGKPRNFGGRDILKEMKRYKKHSKVIVVTQYNEFDGGSISINELDSQLKTKFDDIYKGYVIYKSQRTEEWQNELSIFLKSFI
ncbi:response regulator [Lacihabitans sp. CCS-44]|uniref:response regulator n=1 Tax=Lacihabitans sp. CCS-44 TaxID=2487331 RepID=UPI0020CB75E7|nr:response regulator [Lacihabitans sp. CCS-44]MCP9756853.1 response regulator [Lacihabitans sp. CCS-44]